MEFSEYLKSRFPNQREAAEFFGVTPGAVSHWMTGKRRPNRQTAADIVRLTNGEVTYEHIFGGH